MTNLETCSKNTRFLPVGPSHSYELPWFEQLNETPAKNLYFSKVLIILINIVKRCLWMSKLYGQLYKFINFIC